MSVVEELYGQPLAGAIDQAACRTAVCPFTRATCDGGGNRDMARVEASDPALGPFFNRHVGETTGGHLPCGVCSVRLPRDDVVWAICPRRLLTFGPNGVSDSQAELACKVFDLAGFDPGEEVSVWPEVSLQEVGAGGGRFNYRLDYVLRSTKPGAAPIIVEVMTCSTSGGNRSRGTDIQGAFRRAVLFAHTPVNDPVEAPGVNVRQVWARMASQMIAKSEAANSWGGRTIWVVQDRLVEYIRTNTALPLDALHSPDWTPGEVNMLVSNLTEPVALYAGPIRAAHGSRACWLELLGAPHIPTLGSITRKLEEAAPVATFRVPER